MQKLEILYQIEDEMYHVCFTVYEEGTPSLCIFNSLSQSHDKKCLLHTVPYQTDLFTRPRGTRGIRGTLEKAKFKGSNF